MTLEGAIKEFWSFETTLIVYRHKAKYRAQGPLGPTEIVLLGESC